MPVDIAEIAARLAKARADRTPIEQISAELPDFDLAAAYEDIGDIPKARNAFARARAVYPSSAEVAWLYGNFLLRREEYDEGYAQVQRAVRADPGLLAIAITRTWRSSHDVQLLLDRVLPPNTDAYFQALDFLAANQQTDAGLVVWQRLLALGRPITLSRAFPFLDELIHEERATDSERVWLEALAAAGLPHDPPALHSLVWNGDFAREFANGGLDWRWRGVLGAEINFDRGPAGGTSRAVRLDFTGGSNLELNEPDQYVPVQPGCGYHFHAQMRTEGITTESGIRFSLTDPNHGDAVGVTTENFTGSRAWTPIEADLTTGPQTHFLLLRLLRSPSRLFDNRLGGTAWIAEVALTQSTAAPEQPSR